MKDRLSGDDLLEMGVKPGEVSSTFIPEQERNFDAGYCPSETPRQFVREEWIDGKRYKVFQ